ncbi:AAA+ ATPase [Parasponia andersonii]|uniref:AAA+ ATPase n=1 Tax=Parasponia andersonii TaxID=3476 RepID=A0A2P5ASI6_PARAD|nr:AAA+ ATPase [Parasponia andersonii]
MDPGILGNSAIVVISGIYNSIIKKVSYTINLGKRIHSLTTELNELQEERNDVKTQVEKAEVEGSTVRSHVKGWLQRVEAAENKASVIMEDFVRGQPSKCFILNCRSMYKTGKRVQKVLEEIRELKSKWSFDDGNIVLVNGLPSASVEEIPSRPTVGLDVVLEEVYKHLEEDEVGVIGVYGMGGVGKTTLLKHINNGFLTKTHDFDVVIWVTVSKDFVADKIQQAIEERLGLSSEGNDSNEAQTRRASKIHRVLRGKKFLLFLDDVWEEVKLEEIGIPFPDQQNKCKVIFTTRSKDVCTDMAANQILKVEFLDQKDSWLLFGSKVGGRELIESESILPHARTIVKKCGGLPLALITIGRAMANKETEAEWKNAIEVLNESASELRGMEDVFSLLKFSYDNLENDTLKSCFLYCSLFPEDFSIENEQLVEYWIGEGFLGSHGGSSVHYKGHAVIGSLKVACLLETGEEKTQVKMHDVVRSFALWIASDYGLKKKKFLVQPSLGLTEAPRVEDWKESQRISLLDNGITMLSHKPQCPILSTLILQWNSGLNKISNGFFQFMPALRILDLSFTSLREIPTSIGDLVELQHLDLSGTKLSTLPKELGNLSKLKHLDLQRTHLLKIVPREAISGLLQLRVLNLYYSYSQWEIPNCNSDEKLIGLADLECLRQLATLGISVTDLVTLERLAGLSSLLQCIQFLYIKECEGLLQLILPSSTSSTLRRLSINNCSNLKYLDIGLGISGKKNQLKSLEVLALHGLPNLTTVWKNPVTRECLQNLRYVNIWYCHNLKNVSWVLNLPKLEVIYLFFCKEVEEVVSGNERVAEAFPSLRTLSIRDLPKLRSICHLAQSFPSLERVAVIDCPELKRLPIKAHNNTSNFPTLYGSREWWNRLEWDGATIRSALLPHFIATA